MKYYNNSHSDLFCRKDKNDRLLPITRIIIIEKATRKYDFDHNQTF